jgi:hypothetical protein
MTPAMIEATGRVSVASQKASSFGLKKFIMVSTEANIHSK